MKKRCTKVQIFEYCALGCVLGGFCLSSIALLRIFSPQPQDNKPLSQHTLPIFQDVQKDTIQEKEPSNQEISVAAVVGAVKHPGVYVFLDGQRIADAIASAGGFIREADMPWINQHVNLAQKISDGMNIYIPSQSDKSNTLSFPEQEASLVNVNNAVLSQLTELKGIGETRAQTIIEHRPYRSLEEFQSKTGFSESLMEGLKNDIFF